jgi:hypothetical protein
VELNLQDLWLDACVAEDIQNQRSLTIAMIVH